MCVRNSLFIYLDYAFFFFLNRFFSYFRIVSIFEGPNTQELTDPMTSLTTFITLKMGACHYMLIMSYLEKVLCLKYKENIEELTPLNTNTVLRSFAFTLPYFRNMFLPLPSGL